MLLGEDSINPDLSLSHTDNGYELIDNSNNLRLNLELDDYYKMISENRSHPFNKIIKRDKSKILDCTGGFARDASILASLGHDVTLVENNPLISKLLVDARERILNKEIAEIFARITIRLGNCIEYIRNSTDIFDYIYFDFMFNNTKSALPSKNEQFLRKIVSTNLEENLDIIQETIQRVSGKVIIKEYINSNNYNNFEIINTYRSKTVKYHLIGGKNGY